MEGIQRTYHDKFKASVLIESFMTTKRRNSSASIWVEELWSTDIEAPTVRWRLGWVEDEQ